MKIINLTQHKSTPEQQHAGVIDLEGPERLVVIELLTFDELPPADEILDRAHDIAEIAASVQSAEDRGFSTDAGFIDCAMIGGAPYLMSALEEELLNVGIVPLYAFSKRESIEQTQPDGSVLKRNIFKHIGFVEATK